MKRLIQVKEKTKNVCGGKVPVLLDLRESHRKQQMKEGLL